MGRNKFLLNTGLADNWVQMDKVMLKAVMFYHEITEQSWDGGNEVIFLDHIIRLTICRAFINHQNRKFVTAEKLLILAENMVKKVKQSNQRFCKILVKNNPTADDLKVRQEAPIIPIDILEQKLYFKWGLLKIMFGREELAKQMYLKSITTGQIYDARIRKICLEQLIALLQRQKQSINKMDKLLESFEHKNRDYIFLINGSSVGKHRGMSSYMETVRKSLR